MRVLSGLAHAGEHAVRLRVFGGSLQAAKTAVSVSRVAYRAPVLTAAPRPASIHPVRTMSRLDTARQLQTVRGFSGRAGGTSSGNAGLDRIHGVVREMLAQEAKTKTDAQVSLPSGWSAIDTAGLMQGQLETNGVVLLEKKLPTGEIVNLVSSHDVVNSDDDIDMEDMEDEDEEDDNHENGFKHAETSVLFLVAIAKPGQALPLFCECVGDRFGYEILRVHVGLGMAGFMSDHSGHPALLYHICMSHLDAREGRDSVVPGESMGAGDDASHPSSSSPEFDTLDARLQNKFADYLSEKHVDAVVVEALYDSVMLKGHHKYVHFLENLEQWLK